MTSYNTQNDLSTVKDYLAQDVHRAVVKKPCAKAVVLKVKSLTGISII